MRETSELATLSKAPFHGHIMEFWVIIALAPVCNSLPDDMKSHFLKERNVPGFPYRVHHQCLVPETRGTVSNPCYHASGDASVLVIRMNRQSDKMHVLLVEGELNSPYDAPVDFSHKSSPFVGSSFLASDSFPRGSINAPQ